MAVMTMPSAVALRITYSLPVQAGDHATLSVRVKQTAVPLVEALFGIEIEVQAADATTKTIHGPRSFSTSHMGGPFDQTFEFSLPVATLNEDPQGAWGRDEVLVRVRKTRGASALQVDSPWVESNRIDVYFGKGETTPET